MNDHRFNSVAEIKRRNEESGHFFFSPDTMRFFRSKVYADLFDGRFFLTSEVPPYGERAYTVREAMPDGSIITVGDLCAYSTLDKARRAVKGMS